jgi:hypothetical protein
MSSSFHKVAFSEGSLTVIDDQVDDDADSAAAVKAVPAMSFSQVARHNAPSAAPATAFSVVGGGGDASKSRIAQFATPCRLWAAGKCTFGTRCHFRHDQRRGAEIDDNDDDDDNEGDRECAICLERVQAKGERFGLLLGCEHAFCLKCIREWRSMAQQEHASQASTEAVRSCPICRAFSPFVIPSVRFVSEPDRKQRLQDEFLAATGSTRCKYWNGKPGSCSFGSSCFYRHINADGSVGVDTTRSYVDADGIHVVHARDKTSLADFIVLPPTKSTSSSSSSSSAAARPVPTEVPKWARDLDADAAADVKQFLEASAATPAAASSERPVAAKFTRGFVELDLSRPSTAAPLSATKAAPAAGSADDWSEAEQARLEEALLRFPGEASDKARWQSISDFVGRTKKECVMRFRYCASLASAATTKPK